MILDTGFNLTAAGPNGVTTDFSVASQRVAFEISLDGAVNQIPGLGIPANLTTEPSGNFMDVKGTETNMTTAPRSDGTNDMSM